MARTDRGCWVEDGSTVHKFLKSLVFAASLATAPMALAADVTEPSEAAMTFVGTFSDGHLSGMLSRIGARQQPMVVLSQVYGALLGAVFDAEIDKAVAKYGAQWRKNLGLAWMGLLTTEEFGSLTADAAESPYGEKYLGLRAEAGQNMGRLSQELFSAILAEVIRNTIDQLAEPAEGTSTE